MSKLSYSLVGALLVVALLAFLLRPRHKSLKENMRFYRDKNFSGIVVSDGDYWKKHDPNDEAAFKARALQGFKILDEIDEAERAAERAGEK